MTLRDCESCLVYGTDNRPLAKARVEVTERNQILLYFRYEKLRSIRIKTYIDFYDGQYGVVRCFCEMVIQKNRQPNRISEPWMADCSIITVQDAFQRQKDLRIKTNIHEEFVSNKGTYFSGTIGNISAGGLFLLTGQVLKRNEHFTFRHRFSGALFQVEARVVRVGPLVKGEYSYGCQFVNLNMDAEAAIRKFVFTKQKEKLNSKTRRIAEE